MWWGSGHPGCLRGCPCAPGAGWAFCSGRRTGGRRVHRPIRCRRNRWGCPSTPGRDASGRGHAGTSVWWRLTEGGGNREKFNGVLYFRWNTARVFAWVWRMTMTTIALEDENLTYCGYRDGRRGAVTDCAPSCDLWCRPQTGASHRCGRGPSPHGESCAHASGPW